MNYRLQMKWSRKPKKKKGITIKKILQASELAFQIFHPFVFPLLSKQLSTFRFSSRENTKSNFIYVKGYLSKKPYPRYSTSKFLHHRTLPSLSTLFSYKTECRDLEFQNSIFPQTQHVEIKGSGRNNHPLKKEKHTE